MKNSSFYLDRYAGRRILINGIRSKFGRLSTVDVQVECAPEYGSVVNGILPTLSLPMEFSFLPARFSVSCGCCFYRTSLGHSTETQQTSAAFLSALIAAEYRADEDVNWTPVKDILLLSNNLSADLCHMKKKMSDFFFTNNFVWNFFNEFNQL